MSKELEALKLLQIEYDKLDYTIDIDGVDVIDLLRQALTKDLTMDLMAEWKREDYDTMDREQLIQLMVLKDECIEELKNPPTEQEVGEALGEYMNEPVWFDDKGDIRITTQWVVKQIYLKGEYVGLNFMSVLPPQLITLIGRFYEGKEKE